MDSTADPFYLDENGYCNYCNEAINRINHLKSINNKDRLGEFIAKIKKNKNTEFDCLLGLSGGVDSSYVAYLAKKEFGLNPLAVHLDNGWDSELAVKNIKNIVRKLDIELYTYVIEWEEFKAIQRAFLFSSVIDLELVSDNAIFATVIKVAKKNNIKYILGGGNSATESILPPNWIYPNKLDSLHIRDIYRKYGEGKKIKSYPMLNFIDYFRYNMCILNHYETINILDYVEYDKYSALEILKNELDYIPYPLKHYESIVTAFYQGYILPRKYNVDKRKAHLSSLICSGQISREKALEELRNEPYDKNTIEKEKEYFIKKLDLSATEFDIIMNEPPKSHSDFQSYNNHIKKISGFLKPLMRVKKRIL